MPYIKVNDSDKLIEELSDTAQPGFVEIPEAQYQTIKNIKAEDPAAILNWFNNHIYRAATSTLPPTP